VITRHPAEGRSPAPNGGWVDVVAPDEAERAALIALGVPDALIRDALDTDELARVDHHPTGAKLFVLRVPASELPDAEVVPLGVVTLRDGCVVTISGSQTGIPARLATENLATLTPIGFALRLSLRVAERFVRTARAIEVDAERLEGKLREALENDELLSLLALQKSLVHLDTALTANQIVLERALEDSRLDLNDAERVLVEDALVEIRQAGAMVRTQKELLGNTMDALATLVSNNLNVAMKNLASLTLLVSLPALMAGLYGMNVELPFSKEPHAFVGVLGASGLAVLGVLGILRARRWL
jgi:magnesium transporter